MEEKYKLRILKDILKFSGRTLTKEELNNLLASALYQNKNDFTSAALLVKRGAITIEDFLALEKLTEEELRELIEPVDDEYDYFATISPEELQNAFQYMKDFRKNYPEEARKNREQNKRRIQNIKSFYLEQKDFPRGA